MYIFLNLFYIEYIKNQDKYSVKIEDLVAVKGKLKQSVALYTSRNKAGVPEKLFINLNLKSYADFSFVNKLPYRRFEFDDLSAISLIDSITIFVRKEEYEQKLAKTVALSYWNKYVDYSKIDLYGIETTKGTIIDKVNYLKNNHPDDFLQHVAIFMLNCFLGIVWVISLILFLKNIWKNDAHKVLQ